MKYNSVNLLHIFVTGPLLMYVGLIKPAYDWIYWLLLLVGFYILVSFAWRAFRTPWSDRHVWFAVHGLLFASLLLYVGWKGQETPNTFFSLLLAVGIAAFGYHLVRLLQKNLST